MTHRKLFRSLLVVALLAVFGVATAACDSGAAWVAKVDGTAVDSPHFSQGVKYFAKLSGATTLPDSRGVSPTSNAAQYALFLVQGEAIANLNAKHGSTVSASDVAKVRSAILSSQQGSTFRTLPDWFVNQVSRTQAEYEALTTYFGARVDTNAAELAYYNANKAQFQQVCMDVIAGTDKEQLDSAKSQLEAKSVDFATAAKAVAAQQPAGTDGTPAKALGTKADGNVGCIPVSNLQNLFAQASQTSILTGATPGSLVGPVPVAGGGYMLFRVREAKVQAFDEVKASIAQQLGAPGSTEAQSSLNDYLKTANIELNPRLGSWKNGVGYVAPKGATHPGTTTTVPGVSVFGSGSGSGSSG